MHLVCKTCEETQQEKKIFFSIFHLFRSMRDNTKPLE